jgi:hypothetical protein
MPFALRSVALLMSNRDAESSPALGWVECLLVLP